MKDKKNSGELVHFGIEGQNFGTLLKNKVYVCTFKIRVVKIFQ